MPVLRRVAAKRRPARDIDDPPRDSVLGSAPVEEMRHGEARQRSDADCRLIVIVRCQAACHSSSETLSATPS